MNSSRTSQLLRATVLTSMASLLVAGFIILGGFGSNDSAEGFYCGNKWFNRCPSFPTETTTGTFSTITVATEGPKPTTATTSLVTTDSQSTRSFGFCNHRWFTRCLVLIETQTTQTVH